LHHQTAADASASLKAPTGPDDQPATLLIFLALGFLAVKGYRPA
jgi:hypothetical protein